MTSELPRTADDDEYEHLTLDLVSMHRSMLVSLYR